MAKWKMVAVPAYTSSVLCLNGFCLVRPNLLRPRMESMEHLKDVPMVAGLVTVFIDNCKMLFPSVAFNSVTQ